MQGIAFLIVRDHIPLEQGLRQEHGSMLERRNFVRDHIPLEQGLRRIEIADCGQDGMSETIFH